MVTQSCGTTREDDRWYVMQNIQQSANICSWEITQNKKGSIDSANYTGELYLRAYGLAAGLTVSLTQTLTWPILRFNLRSVGDICNGQVALSACIPSRLSTTQIVCTGRTHWLCFCECHCNQSSNLRVPICNCGRVWFWGGYMTPYLLPLPTPYTWQKIPSSRVCLRMLMQMLRWSRSSDLDTKEWYNRNSCRWRQSRADACESDVVKGESKLCCWCSCCWWWWWDADKYRNDIDQ